jgi:chemotaxis protein MotB
MALKKKEEAPKGSPAWMSTFSDLMNLLLCFFVLLYSMSTVNEEKFQQVIASLSRSMSILPAGGASIGEGEMISSGVRQLEFLDTYYNEMANSESEEETDDTDIVEAYREEELSESEEMAEQLEQALQGSGLQDLVEVDFNAEYVQLSLSGALLFESGSSEIPEDAYPIMDKISAILEQYDSNIIEIEGHTDNVPMYSEKYEDNDVLSMYRALTIANYIRDHSTLNPAYVKSSGRGDYVPIADNSTEEGRARNRRVEIKIYNSYNSDL